MNSESFDRLSLLVNKLAGLTDAQYSSIVFQLEEEAERLIQFLKREGN